MFEQCLIFACLDLRSILLLCEQVRTGEEEVLVEYLLEIYAARGPWEGNHIPDIFNAGDHH